MLAAQVGAALTLPPLLYVQVPVQFRFVAVLNPQPEAVTQVVPISPQDLDPHFLTDELDVHEFVQLLVLEDEPQVFVVAQAWLVTFLDVHDPPQALT